MSNEPFSEEVKDVPLNATSDNVRGFFTLGDVTMLIQTLNIPALNRYDEVAVDLQKKAIQYADMCPVSNKSFINGFLGSSSLQYWHKQTLVYSISPPFAK